MIKTVQTSRNILRVIVLAQIQQNIDDSNTDGSFTMAVSHSFLSPFGKNLIAADLD